ncbi:MAG TPA: hypothetical protein VEO74_09805 [Thermoanaerobaculia bacterium]|nr:hypothetical protein [Thermoanaerobaculia bacterium]
MVRAQFQMPDAKEMSGIPRPVTDLPNGTISVRLIRGDLSNNLPNHPVELHVGSKVLTEKTDEAGRAQFTGLEAGATVKAVAVVDGERLESQEFPAPTQGGVRMMLVATDKSKAPATTPDAPPIAGQVVIGNQSRIVIEPGDEAVQLFYLLDIENTARAPVNPTTPFVFDMPKGASGTAIMDGSSPLATVTGPQVMVQGPFPPGHTFVQVACAIASGSGAIDVTQRFPATLEQLAVVVKKVGDTTLRSLQIANQRELPAEGEMFIAGTGGAVVAGQPIQLSVSGFPHHSPAPRTIALLLAAAIAAVGVWVAGRPNDDEAARTADRKRLIGRREKLFADLVRLENDRRTGRADERRYTSRREELIAALEHVYGALDDDETVAA